MGRHTDTPSHSAGTPPADLAALGQNAHHGYGGQSVSYLNQNILGWLAADNPDLILLKIGTNSQDRNGLDALVQTIVTTKPNASLIIAEIMPKYNYDQGVVDYNAWIRQTLVPKYQALGKKVTRVDQYAPFLTSSTNVMSIDRSLFSNGINHPDNDGYDKMAAVWFEGIEALSLNSRSFTEWIADPMFGINPEDRGFRDDPDGDGFVNGVEAWLGTDPAKLSRGLEVLTGGGADSTFRHSVNKTNISGLEAFYEWSPDLIHWYEANGTSGPPAGPRVSCTVNISGTTASVTTSANPPIGRMFVRLAIVPQ